MSKLSFFRRFVWMYGELAFDDEEGRRHVDSESFHALRIVDDPELQEKDYVSMQKEVQANVRTYLESLGPKLLRTRDGFVLAEPYGIVGYEVVETSDQRSIDPKSLERMNQQEKNT